jgi:hypothetical protein
MEMQMNIAPAQLEQIKATVDIFELANRYTTLPKKESRQERSGPCPHCKGHDRFHVHAAGWWFCRNCHQKRGDVIELVRFAEGCDFVTACERLGAYRQQLPARSALPIATPHTKPAGAQWRTAVWQQRAYELVDQAAHRLETSAGGAGRAYLEQRGIEPVTWRAWLLGYTAESPPWHTAQRRRVGGAAMTIPYLRHDTEEIMAVRYRRIDPQADRYINEPGSACVLHGLHLLDLHASALVITEGEFNAISVWQASRDLGVAIVSIGAQRPGAATLRAVAWLSQQYERCIVWCDEPTNALDVRSVVASPRVLPLQSPKPNNTKIDANTMLQQQVLRPFLERKLALLAE